MNANRLFNLMVAAVVVTAVAFAVQQAFATKAIVPGTSGTYTESSEEAFHEYQLGERYGAIPQNFAQFDVEQIQRDYILGERYGGTPQQYARQQALREDSLGERYGQTPLK